MSGDPDETRDLVQVSDLRKHYWMRRRFAFGERPPIRAVNGVSFTIQQGETFGLVGESGCGKTTLSRIVLRLVPATSGDVLYRGRSVFSLTRQELQGYRQQAQIIFQDPYSSLNPSFTVRTILWEGYRRRAKRPETTNELQALQDLLERVGLRPETLERYPFQLSGGQRQRVGIARALSVGPEFIIADEPVSSLDVSVQSQILNLFVDLQREMGLTYLFITHDLNIVRYVCDRIAVMYLGKIVEMADRESIFAHPLHPYTQGLLSARPSMELSQSFRERRILSGDLPNPWSIPRGCPFHPRCTEKKDECAMVEPSTTKHSDTHWVTCHLYG